jgi:RNA polymerase sigma-32 factor
MLVAERADQESDVAERSELEWRRELLGKGMEVLNARERHILSERRLTEGPKSLEDLSQVYGVSRERIRQIEARAFEKLQKAMLEAAQDAATESGAAIASHNKADEALAA